MNGGTHTGQAAEQPYETCPPLQRAIPRDLVKAPQHRLLAALETKPVRRGGR